MTAGKHIVYYLAFILVTGWAGINNPLKAQEALQTWPGEHLALITDREFYLSGETLWFTVYYSAGNGWDADKLSKIVYVELFNAGKEAILREKFSLVESRAEGSLVIPDGVSSGIYFLRTYTQFQRNFPAESHCIIPVTIVNPDIPFKPGGEGNDRLAIIPEGGQLVYGQSSWIAIQLNQALSDSILSIHIADKKSQIIHPVTFFGNGTGLGILTPEVPEKYFLQIMLKSGDTVSEPFPEPAAEGYVPYVEITPEGVVYRIKGDIAELLSDGGPYFLSVTSEEMIPLFKALLSQEEDQVPVPGSLLLPGIHYFVLENSRGEARHVLPVYIQPKQWNRLEVLSEKDTYAGREKVVAYISPNSALQSNLEPALSVFRQGPPTGHDQGLPPVIIDNPFLLDSYLEFTDPGDSLLSLQVRTCMILYTPRVNTLAFRKKMAELKHPPVTYLPETRDVGLNGWVTDQGSGKPLENVPLLLSVLDQSQFHLTRTRENGRFFFTLHDLNGVQNVILCPGQDQEEIPEIRISSDFSSEYPDNLKVVTFLDSASKNYLEEMWINAQVSALFSTDERSGIKQTGNVNFFGEVSFKVILADYIEMTNLYEVFYEIVPFVQVKKKKDHYRLQVINDRLEVFEDPLILIDNVPVSTVDELMKVPPALIDRIEVINQRYIYGDFVLNGVVLIYTKTDNYAGMRFPAGSVFLEYQTIAPDYSFQSPQYEGPGKKDDHIPDFRNLLFWEPKLEAVNRGTIRFYTSDREGTYDIVVRGWSRDGNPYFGKTSFQVK